MRKGRSRMARQKVSLSTAVQHCSFIVSLAIPVLVNILCRGRAQIERDARQLAR